MPEGNFGHNPVLDPMWPHWPRVMSHKPANTFMAGPQNKVAGKDTAYPG